MSSPLTALEAIDWTGVADCYGPVDELPAMLRATLSADKDERREALMDARNQVNHQGDVCEASVLIVPFLARAALAAPYDREGFLYWLAWSCGREDEAALDRTGLIGQVRSATALALPELATLIRDPEPEIRRAALMLIAAFPHEMTAQLVDLTALQDPDPLVRADLLTVVAFLQPHWARLQDWLTERLGDEDTRVRFQAARVLMRQHGIPYPVHLVDALADAIAEIGSSLDPSEAIDSFCGAPSHSWPTSQATGLVRVRLADPLVQDPSAAAHAARRIRHSASPHAGYALTLAKQIDEEWRDQECEAADIALDALPTVTSAKTQYTTLRWIARLLSDIEQSVEDLFAPLERWSARPEPAIAAAAWTVAARIGKQHTLSYLNTTSALPRMPVDILRELCEIYGSDADCLIQELRRRIEAIPRSQAPRDAGTLIGAVRDLDARAYEFVPLLCGLIESGQGLYALLETLGSFGPAAEGAADLIETVARTHERQHFRIRAARAHRAITGQATLARLVTNQIAEAGTLENFSDVELGLLGPDAAASAQLLEQQLAKGKSSQATLALWRITRDRERFTPLLARAALSDHGALSAVQGLAELGACPTECRQALVQYASAPQRILHTTLHHPAQLDDYLLRRLAKECLAADPSKRT